MSFFKDSKGREWEINLILGIKAKIKSKVGVNFNEVRSRPQMIEEIINDPFQFLSVLCITVEEQCEERGITEQDFIDSIAGDEVETEATLAFIGAVIESFPLGQRRAMKIAFERLWSMTKEKANAMDQKLMDEVERTDFNAMAEKVLTSSSSADSVPDSSESTGSDTRSEN